MPPRLETCRWMVSPAAGSGAGPARRTPWSLCRLPGGHSLDPPACNAHVHGSGVDPERDLLAGPAGAEPELLRADGHVPRWRDHPVDLDRVWPARRLHDRRNIRMPWWRAGDRREVGRSPQAEGVAGDRPRAELLGRGGHVQGLVRAPVVVFRPPFSHNTLGFPLC